MQKLFENKYLFYVGFFLVLCVPVTTRAIEVSSTSTSSTTVVSTSTPIDNVPAAPPIKDTMRAKLQPLAQTRITNLAANLSNRLDATVHRLGNVQTRLDSRLTKMHDEGKNTESAALSLATAQSELKTAENSLGTIDIEVNSFIGSENPIMAWSRLESIYLEIIKNIRSAHTALKDTLSALETAKQGSAITASSSITQ